MVILRSPFELMFGDGNPTKAFVLHVLELTEHFQEFFEMVRIFIGNVNFIFSIMFQPFAVGLLDLRTLFHLGFLSKVGL